MSLAHAVLTSLIEKPSSGYALARRFDKSIGYFWHATHQQIYRELARMEEKGWIVSDTAPDAGATRKREYRVLPTGRAELVRWAQEATPPTDLRDEFTVKLRADAALGEVDLRDELRRRLGKHRAGLAEYQEIEARDFAGKVGLPRAARIQHLILRRGVLYEALNVQWAEDALAVLELP